MHLPKFPAIRYTCRYLSRAVLGLIPLPDEVKFDLATREAVKDGFKRAHFAYPALLQIGGRLLSAPTCEIVEIRDKVCESIPDIDTRLALLYTLSIFVANQVPNALCIHE